MLCGPIRVWNQKVSWKVVGKKKFYCKSSLLHKSNSNKQNNSSSFSSSASIKTAGLLWRSKQAENKKQDIKCAAECRLNFVICVKRFCRQWPGQQRSALGGLLLQIPVGTPEGLDLAVCSRVLTLPVSSAIAAFCKALNSRNWVKWHFCDRSSLQLWAKHNPDALAEGMYQYTLLGKSLE